MTHMFLEKWPKLQELGKNGSNFMITLLSNKKGFHYLTTVNDWTNQALQHWKDKENREYVDRVEKCLMNALDYVGIEDNNNIFRFPDLLNNPDNSFVTLGFIHRMPWIMCVTYETDEFQGSLHYSVTIEYTGSNNSQFILVGKPPYNSLQDFEKTIMNENSQFVIKLNIQVGKCFIDNTCKEISEPYYIRCDFNDKRHLSEFKNNQYIIEKNGISFYFESLEDQTKIRLSQIKLHLKMGENRANQAKIPPHIFGQLVKTTKGIQLLQESTYLNDFIDDIRSASTPIITKRASLWALGQIGSSKKGIKLLNEKEVIQDIVRMAQTQEYLSLRGTCLYILNMLCHTQEGRSVLEKLDWQSHWNSNIGWICIPKDTQQFFHIVFNESKNQQEYWAMQHQYWGRYQEIQQQLNLSGNQLKLLENIALLSNQLTYKSGTKEIKKLRNSNPQLFEDRQVFQSLLLMLRFQHNSRKYIFSHFDNFLSSPNIMVTLDSNQFSNNQII